MEIGVAEQQDNSTPLQNSSPVQITSDQPSTLKTKKRSKKRSRDKQPDSETTDTKTEAGAVEAADPEPATDVSKPSKRAKTPKAAEQSEKSFHSNKKSTKTEKDSHRSERDEQSVDDNNNDTSSIRPRKLQKFDDPRNEDELNSKTDKAIGNTSVRTGYHDPDSGRLNRSIDSYRPSYPNNRPLYRSDHPGLSNSLNPESSTPHHNNIPRGPKKPDIQTINNIFPSNTTHSAPLHHYPNARQHSKTQNTPKSPKNTYIRHQSHSDQPSGARTPRFYQNNAPNIDYSSHTPGYRKDVNSSQFEGNRTLHHNQETRYNHQRQSYNNGQKSSFDEEAIGGRHSHFKDEEDDRLFVSP